MLQYNRREDFLRLHFGFFHRRTIISIRISTTTRKYIQGYVAAQRMEWLHEHYTTFRIDDSWEEVYRINTMSGVGGKDMAPNGETKMKS